MTIMKHILGKMRAICDEFGMIEEGDKIAVGVSGGKDSMLLLYAMGLYRMYIKKDFQFVGVTVDLGLPGFAAKEIEEFAASLGVEHHTVHTLIGDIIFKTRKEKNPCALCSKMRKGAFYEEAKRLHCNKAAFAHSMDDLLETLLLSQIYEGKLSTFSPVTYLSRMDITLIRPFCYIPEKEVIGAVRQQHIPVYKNPCPADGHTKRQEVKELMKSLLELNPNVKKSLLSAIRSAGSYNIWDLPSGLRESIQNKGEGEHV